MLKVMTVLGTRPELIKMSRVIGEFDRHTNHILVHTGQNYDYELNRIFFDGMNIRDPNYFLEISADRTAKAIANIIEKVDDVLEKEKPDAFMIYGDTNSCLSVISAKKRKIPIFHMEAGNRCFDQRVPEEVNRKIVDHMSDVNMVLSEHARRYLIREGIPQELIIKTGSHMREVVDFYYQKIQESKIVESLGYQNKKYFLVSLHREENVDNKDNLIKIMEAIKTIKNTYGFPIVFSTHPRTRKRLESLNIKLEDSDGISFLRPLGFLEYAKLQMSSFCTLSDSGTITEESSIINFPAVTIREAHERPEGMDAGVLIMTGLDEQNIMDSVKIATEQWGYYSQNPRTNDDFQNNFVSAQILKIVMSYTNYINRTVWNKKRFVKS